MKLTTTHIEVQRIRSDLWFRVFACIIETRGAKYGQSEAIKAANAALDRFDSGAPTATEGES